MLDSDVGGRSEVHSSSLRRALLKTRTQYQLRIGNGGAATPPLVGRAQANFGALGTHIVRHGNYNHEMKASLGATEFAVCHSTIRFQCQMS
jgi:hypothetical protein